ncbi:hypothetical protein GA0115240_128517 [Streptomyces sp. DvalAA-14]|nr:hypothetical protein [Streptomyces sp. SID4948]SCD88548.1 hypothetical protein GA0115240_128517 [Streptomyces sp. DvalAA-14]
MVVWAGRGRVPGVGTRLRPLAAERGLPTDASETVRAEFGRWPGEVFGATWITWAEVKRVDWDEPAETIDRRVHRYQRTADGLRYVGKAVWDAGHAEALGTPDSISDPVEGWPEGTEWTVGDTVFRAQKIRRRDAVQPGGEWQPVWTAMETLASLHGDDNVRLVVWFDN